MKWIALYFRPSGQWPIHISKRPTIKSWLHIWFSLPISLVSKPRFSNRMIPELIKYFFKIIIRIPAFYLFQFLTDLLCVERSYTAFVGMRQFRHLGQSLFQFVFDEDRKSTRLNSSHVA